MSKHGTATEKRIARLKRNKVIAVVILFSTIAIAIGQLSGAFSSVLELVKKITTLADHRVFRFGNQTIHFEGGNGNSLEQAIVIRGALTSDAGIAAEKHWIARFYPDYAVVFQALVELDSQKGRQYDQLTIESRETGFRRDLYFDVASFYGSPDSDLSTQRISEKIILALDEATRKTKGKGPHSFSVTIDGSTVTVRPAVPNPPLQPIAQPHRKSSRRGGSVER